MPDRRKSRSKAARAMSEMKADEPRPEPRGRRGDSPAHSGAGGSKTAKSCRSIHGARAVIRAMKSRISANRSVARSEPDDSLDPHVGPSTVGHHASWTVVQLARGNVWESDIPGLRQITST